MKKKWYDHLWIISLTYLMLGFFNILFAWLGLLCFFIPLIIAIAKGTKSYCNRYCGRGQLFGLLGGRFGLSRKKDIPQLPDKDQLIMVYCRSGNRSKQASDKLVKLGYTNIVEFGGINSWPGETVSGME